MMCVGAGVLDMGQPLTSQRCAGNWSGHRLRICFLQCSKQEPVHHGSQKTPAPTPQAGADVDAQDAEGSRPIDAAAAAGQKAVVKLLLPRMASKGRPPASVDELIASAADSRPVTQNTAESSTDGPGPRIEVQSIN